MTARRRTQPAPGCTGTLLPAVRRLSGTSGLSSTETLVIAGVTVTTIVLIFGLFQQDLESGIKTFGRCSKSVLSGSLSGCSSTPPPAPQVAGQQLPPGVTVRNQGTAAGLVTSTPGASATGGRGQAPGVPGAGGRANTPGQSTLGSGPGGVGGAGAPGGSAGVGPAAGPGSPTGGIGGSGTTGNAALGTAPGTGGTPAGAGAAGTGSGPGTIGGSGGGGRGSTVGTGTGLGTGPGTGGGGTGVGGAGPGGRGSGSGGTGRAVGGAGPGGAIPGVGGSAGVSGSGGRGAAGSAGGPSSVGSGAGTGTGSGPGTRGSGSGASSSSAGMSGSTGLAGAGPGSPGGAGGRGSGTSSGSSGASLGSSAAGAPTLDSAKADIRAFLQKYGSGPQDVDSSFSDNVREAFSMTYGFGGMDQFNASGAASTQADRFWSKSMQFTRQANRMLRAGDINGAMESLKQAKLAMIKANGRYADAENAKADMMDGAMETLSQTSSNSFAIASAIGNPVGFIVATPAAIGTAYVAAWALPDHPLAQKILVTGVTLAASIYAGGTLPPHWMALGAAGKLTTAQTAALTASQMYAQYEATRAMKGEQEAMEDLVISLGAMGLTMAPIAPGKNPGDPRRNLQQYFNDSEFATTRRIQNMQQLAKYQMAVNRQNIAKALKEGLPKPPELDDHAITDYRKALNAPGDDSPLPDASPEFKQKFDSLELTPEQMARCEAFAKQTGQDVDVVIYKTKMAIVKGTSDAYRLSDPQAAKDVGAGEAFPKDLHQKAKSSRELGNLIPLDQSKSKLGLELKAAQDRLASLPRDADASDMVAALRDVQKVRQKIEAFNQKGWQALGEGHYDYTLDPKSGEWVFSKRGLKVVADDDWFSTSVTSTGPLVQHRDLGTGNDAEKQHLADMQYAGGKFSKNHQHYHEGNNGNPLPLENEIDFYTPNGPIRVVGKDQIVLKIRELGMVEHPEWHKMAGVPPPPNLEQLQQIRQAASNPAIAKNQALSQQAYLNDVGRNAYQTNFIVRQALANMPKDDPRRPELERLLASSQATMDAVAPQLKATQGRIEALNRLTGQLENPRLSGSQRQAVMDQIRTITSQNASLTYAADSLVTRTLGLPRASAFPDAIALPAGTAVPQALIHERVHDMASPAWRSEHQLQRNLHEGASEHFTRQAIAGAVKQGVPVQQFSAFAGPRGTVENLAGVVGDDGLRQAYFYGDPGQMNVRMGTALGAQDPAEAERIGRNALDTLGQALDLGLSVEVNNVMTSLRQGRGSEAQQAIMLMNQEIAGADAANRPVVPAGGHQ